MTQAARDELIEMGECPTCHNPWSMTVGEKSFFQAMIAAKATEGEKFSMPKNCRDCRAIKRNKKITPESIISRVEHMVREAEKGHYIMDDEELANDLRSVTKMLKQMFGPKNRSSNDKTQNPESVGQHTDGGGLQAES
jgi:hypothetical protein